MEQTNDKFVVQLWKAAFSGDNQTLQNLIANPNHSANINCADNPQGHSALFFACYGNANAETVKLLLDAGADPYQRDNAGCLPLHFAANSLDPDIINAVLAAPNMSRFKLDIATGTGQSPLHALFLPNTPKAKNIDLSKCISLILDKDNDPLGALHKKDNNGLSSLMLVKHYNLQGSFAQHVSPRTFAILLKSVWVPGNINEILSSDLYRRIALEELSSNSENTSIMRPRP